MAKANTPAQKPKTPKYYKVFIRSDAKLKNEALFVGVNGRSYAVPRNKETVVPEEVYEVIRQSEAQDNHTQEVIAELIQQK